MQNALLKQQFDVQAFPSVLAIKTDGSEIDRLVGYLAGSGPYQWIQAFKAMSGIV
jgi:thioredoxin-related protein